MRYIGIIILLVLCLTSLLLTDCMINTVKPEPASWNLENNKNINQSSNNSQSSSTGLVYETVIAHTGESVTVYPQQWATGDGTVENPWANDCIQKAYDAVPVGGTIFLKEGYYTLSAQLSINKQINIIGEDIGKTIITTANEGSLYIYMTDYVTLKGFTIDGATQMGHTSKISVIGLDKSEYVLLRDIEVKNGGYYGINVFQVNHSLFQNIYAHDNYSLGLHAGTNAAGWNKYNTYRNIYAWDNGSSGFDDRGTGESGLPIENCYNVYDNLNCWDNGADGIFLGHVSNCALSNSSVSGNGSYGIHFAHIKDFSINNCLVTLSTATGLRIISSENINFTNVIVKNNDVENGEVVGGIIINNSSGIKFTSCQSYDDRNTPLQEYGIQLEGTDTEISLLNCKLSPNSLGEIYNPAGAVVTIIIQKRGSFFFCPCEGVKRPKQSLLATFLN